MEESKSDGDVSITESEKRQLEKEFHGTDYEMSDQEKVDVSQMLNDMELMDDIISGQVKNRKKAAEKNHHGPKVFRRLNDVANVLKEDVGIDKACNNYRGVQVA